MNDSAHYLAENLHRVPVHVIPCIQWRQTTLQTFDGASLYGSIVPAVWSFMLALRSRDLGSVLTTMHLRRDEEAAKLLGIPDDFTQVALVPVAHTDPAVFKPVRRIDAAEVIFHDR